MQEIQWFFARAIPDMMRLEPRNVGLIVRYADDTLVARFLGEKDATVGRDQASSISGSRLPAWLNDDDGLKRAYKDKVRDWREKLQKYGPNAMVWLPKKYKNGRVHLVFAGNRFASHVDFDAMFEELVL